MGAHCALHPAAAPKASAGGKASAAAHCHVRLEGHAVGLWGVTELALASPHLCDEALQAHEQHLHSPWLAGHQRVNLAALNGEAKLAKDLQGEEGVKKRWGAGRGGGGKWVR